jgi:hypothetical protein
VYLTNIHIGFVQVYKRNYTWQQYKCKYKTFKCRNTNDLHLHKIYILWHLCITLVHTQVFTCTLTFFVRHILGFTYMFAWCHVWFFWFVNVIYDAIHSFSYKTIIFNDLGRCNTFILLQALFLVGEWTNEPNTQYLINMHMYFLILKKRFKKMVIVEMGLIQQGKKTTWEKDKWGNFFAL